MSYYMRQHKSRFKEKGQAMTEFAIAVSFFLIPLFFGISLIAKYIDMKQANVQAARYQAWEYTVWYADNGELRSGFDVDGLTQPIKSTAETRNESKQRFYRNVGNEEDTFKIEGTDKDSSWNQSERNQLWTNHRGEPLYGGVDGQGATLENSEPTPPPPGVIGTVTDLLIAGIEGAFSLVQSILSSVGSSAGFDAVNKDGYAVAHESMRIDGNPEMKRVTEFNDGPGQRLDGSKQPVGMSISTTASVLSDGWSAGGVDHAYNQVGGATPTTALKQLMEIGVVATAVNTVAALFPELSPCGERSRGEFIDGTQHFNPNGSFWLGYIDTDAVHSDRLYDPLDSNNDASDVGSLTTGSQQCNDAGKCVLEPVNPRPNVRDRECDR
jgi:hypothetical protein